MYFIWNRFVHFCRLTVRMINLEKYVMKWQRRLMYSIYGLSRIFHSQELLLWNTKKHLVSRQLFRKWDLNAVVYIIDSVILKYVITE